MGIGAGDVLGGEFRIDRKVGEGGMGTVYRGWQLSLDRPVAVKVLKLNEASDPDDALDFFTREGIVLGSVGKHPAITDVYYKGIHDGLPYLVMEWADGEPLDAVVERDGVFGEPRALRIVVSICEALAAAHAKDLVHRDLKTDNVMLLPDESIKLLDFGIARLFTASTGDPRRKRTDTGTIKGTIRCMPPEQAGGREVDHRADLFSLGVILYELLTGHRPYDELRTVDSEGNQIPLGPVQVAIKIVSGEPVTNVKVYRPDVSDATAAFIDKAMTFDRDARFQSAAEMKYAATQCLMARVQAVPAKPTDRTIQTVNVSHERPTLTGHSAPSIPTPAQPASTPRPRRGWLVVGVVAFVAIAVAAVVIIATGNSKSKAPAPTAAIPTVVPRPTTPAAEPQIAPVPPPASSPETRAETPPSAATSSTQAGKQPDRGMPNKSASSHAHAKKTPKAPTKDGVMDPFNR